MMEKSDLEDGEREEGDGTSEDSSDCSDITEDHPNSDVSFCF